MVQAEGADRMRLDEIGDSAVQHVPKVEMFRLLPQRPGAVERQRQRLSGRSPPHKPVTSLR